MLWTYWLPLFIWPRSTTRFDYSYLEKQGLSKAGSCRLVSSDTTSYRYWKRRDGKQLLYT
jgi:hypothetical protein